MFEPSQSGKDISVSSETHCQTNLRCKILQQVGTGKMRNLNSPRIVWGCFQRIKEEKAHAGLGRKGFAQNLKRATWRYHWDFRGKSSNKVVFRLL